MLEETHGSSKVAIVCILCNTDVEHANELLNTGGGFIRKAVAINNE